MQKAWEEEGINCQSVMTIPENSQVYMPLKLMLVVSVASIIGVVTLLHVILQLIVALPHISMHYRIIV